MGLNAKQINDLSTGVKLATELKSSGINLRKFLTILGYIRSENGKAVTPDKYLKPDKINSLLFEVRIYELPLEYYTNNWDVTDDDLVNDIYMDDIKGLEKLESILNDYITDFSELKPEWLVDTLL